MADNARNVIARASLRSTNVLQKHSIYFQQGFLKVPEHSEVWPKMSKIGQNWAKCMGYSTRIFLEFGHFCPNLRMFGNYQQTFLEE